MSSRSRWYHGRMAVPYLAGMGVAAWFLVSGVAFAANEAAAPVTFTKDVAPILRQNCQNCHSPGEMAPMPLITYQQVRPWARSIRNKVTRREMPPWFIDRSIGIQNYKNDSSLTDSQIETIVKWVDAGAPEGNPTDLPPTAQTAKAEG